MSINKAKNEVRFPAFRNAFLELKGSMTTTDFAKKLGMSRATVGFYEAGDRIPDALGIVKIAKTCNVSADWLLGLSKERDPQKTAVDELGLSHTAVQNIKYVCPKSSALDTQVTMLGLNLFLECEPFLFACQELGKLSELLSNYQYRPDDTVSESSFAKIYPSHLDAKEVSILLKIENDIIVEKMIENEILEKHPELNGHFFVKFGIEAIDERLNSLLFTLECLVKDISGYNKYFRIKK